MMKKKWIAALLLGAVLCSAGCGASAEDEQMTVEVQQDTSEENISKLSPDLELPAGILIEEQTFEAALDDWGTVTFASYAPENSFFAADGQNADVRFYLMDGEQILYEFPGGGMKNTRFMIYSWQYLQSPLRIITMMDF